MLEGFIIEEELAKKEYSNETTKIDSYINDKECLLSSFSRNIYQSSTTILPGIIIDGNIEDATFNTFYLIPKNLDDGIIVEQHEYQIRVWNAWMRADKTDLISSISNLRPDGTTFSGKETPLNLNPGAQETFVLTVLEDGPAVQDTYYYFNLANFGQMVLYISGKRLVVFPYFPDWKSYAISYNANTIIYRNEKFKEQRRALMNKILRETSANFLFETADGRKLFADLKYFTHKTLGVPVFVEAITPTQNLVGLMTIGTNENLSELWNLKELVYIVIFDSTNPRINEIKEIQSIGTNSIVLKNAVIGNFLKDTTVIYPVYFGIFNNTQIEEITDGVLQVGIEFKEILV